MKRWIVAEETPEVLNLVAEAGLSPVVAQLLVNRAVRNVEGAKKFLYPKRSQIHLPCLLPDLDQARLRIKKAISDKERVLIFGDYDVDGVTSLAMMSGYLRSFGLDFKVLIPDRFTDGYGFNRQALDLAKKEKRTLIIALDCGTNSSLLDEAVLAGIDVIVVDHHEVLVGKRSYLLVNPNRKDSDYPFKKVSSGVLTFKLIWSLKESFPYEYADLAALAIVCDVTPLVDENRALLREGLAKLRTLPCLGLDALLKSTSLKKENIDVFHLGWILGPRLNSSGRLSSARPSWELLATDSEHRASVLADFLESSNKQRRLEASRVLKSVLSCIEKEIDLKEDYAIVLAQEGWHLGVLGLAASRIKERFSRPVFIICLDKDIGVGSGRSVEGFNLIEALRSSKKYLRNYGGHKKACGIEIAKGQIENFRQELNRLAKAALKGKDLTPSLFIDRQLEFAEINPSLVGSVSRFAPYGEANPEPIFLTKGVKLKDTLNGKSREKLVWLKQETDKGLFVYPLRVKNSSKLLELADYTDSFDIVYSLIEDRTFSEASILLKLWDVRIG